MENEMGSVIMYGFVGIRACQDWEYLFGGPYKKGLVMICVYIYMYRVRSSDGSQLQV